MKTVTEIQTAGFRVAARIPLERGGPYHNERALEAEGVPAGKRYIKIESTQFTSPGKTLSNDELEAGRQALEGGETVVLTAADYAHEPQVISFEEKEGAQRYGGPGGYPYREKVYHTTGSQSLSDFVRQLSPYPQAIWAIRPATGTYPDPLITPELYIFEPVGDSVSSEDAARLVFGKMGDVTSAPKSSPGSIRVEDDAVYIGGLRIDRKQYMFLISFYGKERSE